ncbi:MAG: co-chaperone DjlA [Neptuniibacter caesariensis]|uniref:Co-chaperone DjlA n=1 Tax=Neptuniibacter caesariensis TaxID=207954 RepID=A0A2G6JN79_NEPCE|nr:MAG: co-chaperone DjlA [Neptuniibacter caesariensis]
MDFDPQAKGAEIGETMKKHSTAILLCAAVGLYSGGLFGLIFGGIIGYFIGRGLSRAALAANPQEAFFKATFTVMGKLAKADGRVTEDEIQFARDVMAQMRLDDGRRKQAIEYFTAGKAPDFELEKVLKPLAIMLRHRTNVKLMFIEILLQAAMADGEVSDEELLIIDKVCRVLDFGDVRVEDVIARVKAQRDFYQHGQAGVDSGVLLKDAYAVLGVKETASDAEIKKAYRRQMSQHHPDKLVSKGLPEEMIELAKEKSQEIQAAYERIKNARK